VGGRYNQAWKIMDSSLDTSEDSYFTFEGDNNIDQIGLSIENGNPIQRQDFPGFKNTMKYFSSSNSSNDFEIDSEYEESNDSSCSYNALTGVTHWCNEKDLSLYEDQLEAYYKLIEEEKLQKEEKNDNNLSNFKQYSLEFLLSLRPKPTARPTFFSMNVPLDLLKEDSTKLW
jgi:hypothetical protein